METLQPHSSGRPWQVGVALSIAFAGLLVAGLVPRLHRNAELAAAASAAKSDVPVVTVAKVMSAPASSSLDLPGEIKPFQEAAVFARSSGYLKSRLVDIGDHVSAGQLLAEIQSPELDRELEQARAALGQAQASLDKARTDDQLARTTAHRWQNLRKDGSVAQQDADEKQAAFEAQSATVKATEAGVTAAQKNVQRLEELASYERVEAPFAGTITARGADPGALIGPGGGSANGSLFKLVRLDRLRIDVNVPEPYAPTVHDGQDVQVMVRELGKPYPGRVVRTAGVLDPASRTLLVEIELKNDGHLMPGMYAQAQFEAKRAVPALQVPGNAIVTRAKGNEVALVDAQGHVHYQPVVTGPDDGTNVEIESGLHVGDSVVIGPSDDVREGARVKATEAPKS